MEPREPAIIWDRLTPRYRRILFSYIGVDADQFVMEPFDSLDAYLQEQVGFALKKVNPFQNQVNIAELPPEQVKAILEKLGP